MSARRAKTPPVVASQAPASPLTREEEQLAGLLAAVLFVSLERRPVASAQAAA